MLQPRLSRPSRALEPSLSSLAACLNTLSLCPRHAAPKTHPSHSSITIRSAHHASQGRANGPKDTAGRRLGAKKSASEYVVPGNIIFKQRGTKWHPGENVGIGKDHTIYATVAGYVRYYQNPALHPKRRYIGVALEREGPRGVLPTPANAPTRRRLGMYATPIASPTGFLEAHLSDSSKGTASSADLAPTPTKAAAAASPTVAPLIMRPGYENRMSNYSIGRAAERKGVVVREFDRKDRWTAWRKRARKVKAAAIARAAKANRKTKGKKVNKGMARAPRGKKTA